MAVPPAAPPPLSPPKPEPPSPRGRGDWRKPEVIVASLAALISLVALGFSIRATVVASDANNIARSQNSLNAMTSLTGASDSLQKRFKDAGIDDIPGLENFFLAFVSDTTRTTAGFARRAPGDRRTYVQAAGSQQTLCRRGRDSNPRSLSRRCH